MKFNFALYAARDAGGEGNIWFSFKFQIFCSFSEVSVVHLKVTVAPSVVHLKVTVTPSVVHLKVTVALRWST